MIKNIIFDFDGTIADTFNINVAKVLEIAKKEGYSLNFGIEYFRDKDMKQIVLNELNIPLIKVPGIVKKIRPAIREMDIKSKIFPGMKQTLKTLSSTYKIGILSSNSKETVEKFLEKNNIDFVSFVHSDDTLFGKNKAISKIISKHGLKRKETIYVGDEVRDLESSRKASIKCISVTWGYNSKKLLSKFEPDCIIEKPKELVKAKLLNK